jgi:hypothetical protein
MAKKQQVAVTLRKPPQASADTFVAGKEEAPVPVAAVAEAPRRTPVDEIVTRPDGRAFREMTVYLPADVARRLSLHCLDLDRDVSKLLTEVVSAHLDEPAPVVAAPEPPKPVNALERGREVVRKLLEQRPWWLSA